MKIQLAAMPQIQLEEEGGLSGIGNLAAACRDAIIAEAAALFDFAERLGPDFLQALQLIHTSTGPLVVAGIGKSGHIAKKIASTFSSIGKPSVFVHAAEASHGDLGVIQTNSAVLILSNSGETSELSDLIHYCKVHDIDTVAITANAESTLARNSTATIAYGQVQEVCPNGLAPTTSTTLSLAIGDALAVGLVHLLGTAPEDFRRYHPGGKLGAKLLSVGDLMHVGDALPVVAPDTPMAEAVVVMSEKSLGILVSLQGDHIHGVVTDGDMRRNVNRLWHSKVSDIATPDPVFVRADCLAADALELMTVRGITACLVEDEVGRLIGLLHIHDCLRASVKQ
ncbi:KpsF/GutQ family sugar-phosphate isomerase [Rhizorhapis suberifaciens]|uniref:Arabinose-5-phosphate isomerase n=1 Tax=Rhizorhapis suberifaciens TaxID=13656 RepID=A0A840HR55_9SPHN|nr:KpsF/GutQ family sugar-phosphate isomerase [Rhizorhapis suberifaciens]MBB4640078.1 arabinose-5-phosphate isomerase [Rhizorhapis suberifaciens]